MAENSAKVILIRDDSSPPPLVRVMLDRIFDGYRSRLIIASDGTIGLGEPDDTAALGISGEFRAAYALPRNELVEWLRTAILMLEA